MTRPRSALAGLLGVAWVRRALTRRIAFLVFTLLFSVLCVFPRSYLATVKLAPQESYAAGFSTILGQLGGNFASLLGGRQPVEVDLAIARSHYVEHQVVVLLGLATRPGFRTSERAELRVRRMTQISVLRGGVVAIRARSGDPQLALAVASAYATVLQNRLAVLSRAQSAGRRAVLQERFTVAEGALVKAQAAMAAYRSTNHLASPESQFGAAVSQIAGLQASLQARRVELASLLRFETPDNFQVKLLESQISGLTAEIAEAQGRNSSLSLPSAQILATRSIEYLNLFEKVRFAQTLSATYAKYLEDETVEGLAARLNLQIIEPAYVDPARQFNTWAVALLALVIVLACLIELYALTPPVGLRQSGVAAP